MSIVARPISVAFALHALLVLFFDYVPEGLRQILAAGLALLYIGIAANAARRGSQHNVRAILICICLIIFTWGIAYVSSQQAQENPNINLSVALRELAPLFGLVAYLSSAHLIPPRLVRLTMYAFILSGFVHGLLMPQVILNFSYRWAPFTSGLHTSAYTIAAAGVLAWNLHQLGQMPKLARNIVLILSSLLLFEYGVRTAQLLFVSYFGLYFFMMILASSGRKIENFVILSSFFVMSVALISMIILSMLSFDTLSQITSGRLENYLDRLSHISDRSSFEFLFGTGPGSDLLVTDVWWWAAKDSHNDFIHFLWEGGVFVLMSIVAILVILWNQSRWAMAPFIFAIFITSASSNALFSRPNASFILFCAMSLALAIPGKARTNVRLADSTTTPKSSRPNRPISANNH